MDEHTIRHSALTLAVQTSGEPNKVECAERYLKFLKAGDAAVNGAVEAIKTPVVLKPIGKGK